MRFSGSGFQSVLTGFFGAFVALGVAGFALTIGQPAADKDWLAAYDKQMELYKLKDKKVPKYTTIKDLIRDYVPDLKRNPWQKGERKGDAFDKRCAKNELHWFACALYFEARGECLECQLTMAKSLLTRVRDRRRWPNTIKGVVRHKEWIAVKCQYSFRCDGKPDIITDEKAWTTALFIAQKAIDSSDLTCAHSYHADYVKSERALAYFKRLQRHEQVGRHIFYCDKTPVKSKEKGKEGASHVSS